MVEKIDYGEVQPDMHNLPSVIPGVCPGEVIELKGVELVVKALIHRGTEVDEQCGTRFPQKYFADIFFAPTFPELEPEPLTN